MLGSGHRRRFRMMLLVLVHRRNSRSGLAGCWRRKRRTGHPLGRVGIRLLGVDRRSRRGGMDRSFEIGRRGSHRIVEVVASSLVVDRPVVGKTVVGIVVGSNLGQDIGWCLEVRCTEERRRSRTVLTLWLSAV